MVDLDVGNSGSSTNPVADLWQYTGTNFTDLDTVVAPTAIDGELAFVYAGQGVWLINRKPKGIYVREAGIWVYANQEIQDQLQSAQTTLSNHISNTSNPHLLTKTQIGLGNVDNTSDVNKPISIAQNIVNADLQSQIDASENLTIADVLAANTLMNC